LITADERGFFERQGYLLIEDALSPDRLDVYVRLHDRIYREDREKGRLAPAGGASNRPGAMHTFGFLLRDPEYLELLDLSTTFPKVCGILGWNIYVYHSHIDLHPPLDGPVSLMWRWHQDGGRQNLELETEPTRPRLSVKVAFFLSDVSRPGRGKMLVIPGSHRANGLPRPADQPDSQIPPDAVPICAKPGSALLFDRRLWHSRSDNRSSFTRKALFLAYTYRWIRPRDEVRINWRQEPYRSLSPVRKQLLGWGEDATSFWGLGSDASPICRWVRDRVFLDTDQPSMR